MTVKDGLCSDIKDNQTCITSNQDGDPCVWCVCHAVPSSCVTATQAKSLPPSIFTCSKPPAVTPAVAKPAATSCLDIKDSVTCAQSNDGNSSCVWCVSKAVPSSCVDKQQAARLPHSIFNCNATVPTTPAVVRAVSPVKSGM